MTLPRPALCFVTDRRRAADPSVLALVDRIGAAARAGVGLVQIRERDLDDRALVTLVRDSVAVVAGTGARVLVNDRVDVAIAAGAAGVHLRGDSVGACRVRPIVSASFLIGRSVHSVEAAREAEAEGGCDYLLFGTLFPSHGKPEGHPVAGVEALARVCRAVSLPVIAIGGIDASNAPSIARAGAAGAAAVGAFMTAPDRAALASTVDALRRALTPDPSLSKVAAEK
jgi:thiamine-phosphate pyrophosphorylase